MRYPLTSKVYTCRLVVALLLAAVCCPDLPAAPPLPDFVVESVVLQPARRTVGKPVTVTVTVRNQGTASGVADHIDLWLNRPDAVPPVMGDVGDWWGAVGMLEPGQSRIIKSPPLMIGKAGVNRLCAWIAFEHLRAESSYTNNCLCLDYQAMPGNAELDLDGDNLADPALFQPSTGVWEWHTGGANVTFAWGASSMTPVPADYDGDGQTDLAHYQRSTGKWLILFSAGGSRVTQFGWGRTVPLPGDYDGDGKADLALFNPDSARWYIQGTLSGTRVLEFGKPGMIPVPADYDGDGITDLALYEYPAGNWLILHSSNGDTVGRQFGWNSTIPVPADYDGDGRADIAILNRPTSKWCILFSSGGGEVVEYGWKTMIPVPADYNGDGKTEIAMYVPSTGFLYIRGKPALTVLVGPYKFLILLLPTIHAWFGLP